MKTLSGTHYSTNQQLTPTSSVSTDNTSVQQRPPPAAMEPSTTSSPSQAYLQRPKHFLRAQSHLTGMEMRSFSANSSPPSSFQTLQNTSHRSTHASPTPTSTKDSHNGGKNFNIPFRKAPWTLQGNHSKQNAPYIPHQISQSHS